MGYNLYIGEFCYTIHPEDRFVSVGVSSHDGVEIGAPLNSSDNHSNECWPSYSGWKRFAVDVGLDAVFFGDGDRVPWFKGASGHEHAGLLRHHPGAAALFIDHRYAFYEARQRYRARPADDQDVYVNRRLDWLVWWTDWALKNCQYPTFANS